MTGVQTCALPILAVSGHIAAVGERIEAAGWVFEVVDVEGKRIDKVLAARVAQPDLFGEGI